MRTLLRVVTETTTANKAVSEGTLPQVIRSTMERLHPEAAYFYTAGGKRACMMVFDLKDPSEIPVIAEPLFMTLNAEVEFLPVMNIEDLQKGLQAVRKSEFAEAQ